MEKISIVALIIALTGSLNLQAQTAPAIQWEKTIGGNLGDVPQSIHQTSDGNFIMGGYSRSVVSGDKNSANQGFNDYWIVRLSSNGTKIWDRTFGGDSEDFLAAALPTADGGFIVGGSSRSEDNGNKTLKSKGLYDYWIIKLNSTGNKVWEKVIGGSNNDYLNAMQQTADGGYILAGYSQSGISADKTQPARGVYAYWVVKLDASGNKVWDKTYGGSGLDVLRTVQQTTDGGYILGGHSDSPVSIDKTQNSKGNNDYWILKIDAAGNRVWDKTYGGIGSDELASLKQTSDGGYIVGGTSNTPVSPDKSQGSKGLFDYWVLKLDATGNKVWDKTIGGNYYDGFSSVIQTSDGGYLLGGRSESTVSGDKTETQKGLYDYWVVKLDNNGTKVWDKTLGGFGEDHLTCMLQSSDGSYLLGGSSDSSPSGDKSQASKGSTDFWLVNLASDITGLNEEAASGIYLFPNPTSGLITIQSELSGDAQLNLYNALGQHLQSKTFNSTDKMNTFKLDLSGFAKGIYTIQIINGNRTVTRKIVFE